jgi:hypothetical protein
VADVSPCECTDDAGDREGRLIGCWALIFILARKFIILEHRIRQWRGGSMELRGSGGRYNPRWQKKPPGCENHEHDWPVNSGTSVAGVHCADLRIV